MKFTAILTVYANADGWSNIQFPCAGFVNNLSLIISRPESGDINDYDYQVPFGS